MTREEFIRIFERSGKTRRNFGKFLGCSEQLVSYIINGKRRITQALAQKVRDAYPQAPQIDNKTAPKSHNKRHPSAAPKG